jgi:PilZ domain-containing protein
VPRGLAYGRVRVPRRKREESPGPAVEAGSEVTVWIRGLGRTAGTVDAVAEREAQITLAVDPRFGDDSIGEVGAVVEHTAARGLYCQPGELSFEPGGMRVSFTPAGDADLVQRREFVRLPVALAVNATLAKDDTQVVLHVVNLSANGLLVRQPDDASLAEGATLWLSLPLDSDLPPIAPRGSVVRGTEAGTHAIRFDYIAESDQDRLARFVMREQLRLRREGKL